VLTLVLDTAQNACSAAVSRNGVIVAHASEAMQRGHQERLAPMVEAVMGTSGADFEALSRIGVTIGPGSFTGLRVGLAFAKALSLALDIPCIGVNSLEALAAGRTGFVAAAIAAKGDQIYLQAFLNETSLMAPDVLDRSAAGARIAELWSGDQATLVGSGAAELADVLPSAAVDPAPAPDICALARLVEDRPTCAVRPRPLYLRPPDAKAIAERLGART
jgi:tRNA threonylcarbamoyladenosine biosynthesis protein TsaB